MQEWRRKIDGFNMLEQPQQHFELFKVSPRVTALTSHASLLHLLVRLASLHLHVPEHPLRHSACMQGFFDHGVMAMTRKKHPVWVIKVRTYLQDHDISIQAELHYTGKGHPKHRKAPVLCKRHASHQSILI